MQFKDYNIRHALPEDLDDILNIYTIAKQFMVKTGNPNQWSATYPAPELLLADIAKKQCYVYEEAGRIHAVFVFILGDDPTYQVIEDGAWKNDLPYGTIHRIASDGQCHQIFSKCLDFCLKIISNIRIDTHHDNKVMQSVVQKNGFERCGIIHLANGSPRIAYQLTLS